MLCSSTFAIETLNPTQTDLFRQLLAVFSDVFEEPEVYNAAPPSDAYLQTLLTSPTFFCVVARDGESVVGGLTAYVLPKYEQPRAEMYIYDLAVQASYRRQGIATALIEHLKGVAKEQRAYVIFVQADPPDKPAVALYDKLGVREEVFHFDILP